MVRLLGIAHRRRTFKLRKINPWASVAVRMLFLVHGQCMDWTTGYTYCGGLFCEFVCILMSDESSFVCILMSGMAVERQWMTATAKCRKRRLE